MNGGMNFEDILNTLSQNPDTMKKLMSAVGNVMNKEEAPSSEQTNALPTNSFDNKVNKNEISNLIRLLSALQPYMTQEKREKIQSIIRILKIVEMGESAGLLNNIK